MSGYQITIVMLLGVDEFMRGFAISFSAFLTLKYLFFREIKNFSLFSICSGVMLSTVVVTKFLMSKAFEVDVTWVIEGFLLLVILSGWLLLTKRNMDSLISTALAVAFAQCVILNFEKLIFACSRFLLPASLSTGWVELWGYIVTDLLSIGFIFLLHILAGNKNCEPLSKWNMLLLTGIVSVIGILIENHFSLSYANSDVDPVAVIPVSVTFLFIVVAVILSVRSSQTRYYSRMNRLNEEYMTAQAKHFEKVRESDTEMRRLRHDMNNHILCMMELYRLEKYQELGIYLEQLSDKAAEIKAVVQTGNEIVDAIINEKAEEAEKFHIQMDVDGDFKSINIPAMDLCTIFANLLDNAVEASKSVKEGERQITVSTKKTGSFLFLTIKNNVASYVEISDTMKTTKSNKKDHGFGIENVERAVKKCGGEFRLDCGKAAGNYVFTAEVMLPIKIV